MSCPGNRWPVLGRLDFDQRNCSVDSADSTVNGCYLQLSLAVAKATKEEHKDKIKLNELNCSILLFTRNKSE